MLLTSPPATRADSLSDALALVRTGRITEAIVALQPYTRGRSKVPVLAALIECRLARGELVLALALGASLQAASGQSGRSGALACLALGELASASGDDEVAAASFAAAGRRLGPDGDDPDVVPWLAGAALAMIRLGDSRAAGLLAEEHLVSAQRSGAPYAVAAALRVVAATRTGGGRPELLREARATLAGVTADRLAAQIDTDLAGLLALELDPAATEEAVALLRAAEDYADREDLWPLQNRTRRLLARLGEEPRLIRSEALATLTVTERRVARLAAESLTNREIAGQLSTTPKAVEWHLSHIYRKLGIPGRAGLAVALGLAV